MLLLVTKVQDIGQHEFFGKAWYWYNNMGLLAYIFSIALVSWYSQYLLLQPIFLFAVLYVILVYENSVYFQSAI